MPLIFVQNFSYDAQENTLRGDNLLGYNPLRCTAAILYIVPILAGECQKEYHQHIQDLQNVTT